jgi:hypothetical protein
VIGDGLPLVLLSTDLPADEPWMWRGRVYGALAERFHTAEGDGCPACTLFAPVHVRSDGRPREEARPVVFRPGPEGLEVLLFGEATRWAEDLAACLPRGVFSWRKPNGLLGSAQAVELCEWLRPLSGTLLVEFRTPLRLKVGGRWWSGDLEASLLASVLSFRLRRLRSRFGDGVWADDDVDRALEEAGRARVTASFLTLVRARRYSTRHERHLSLSGYVGWARIEDAGGSLGRLLSAGEYIHAGKDTVMGCGQMVVRSAEVRAVR